jgi:hypothetical protein
MSTVHNKSAPHHEHRPQQEQTARVDGTPHAHVLLMWILRCGYSGVDALVWSLCVFKWWAWLLHSYLPVVQLQELVALLHSREPTAVRGNQINFAGLSDATWDAVRPQPRRCLSLWAGWFTVSPATGSTGVDASVFAS